MLGARTLGPLGARAAPVAGRAGATFALATSGLRRTAGSARRPPRLSRPPWPASRPPPAAGRASRCRRGLPVSPRSSTSSASRPARVCCAPGSVAPVPSGMSRSVNRCVGGGVGLQRLRDAEVEGLVDQAPARHVVPVDERDRDARGAGAAGAADAVQVGLLVLGALVVDDVRDALDVDAAGGDVGGDEDVDLAVAERAQRLLAGALAEVAVDGGRRRSPRSARSSATLATVRLVRQKIMVRPRPSACRMRASISTLSIACAR